MDAINLDSDCEILDPNVSTITVADSQEDSQEEDGEIEDDAVEISDETERVPLFEIKFQHKRVFQQLGHTILSTLQAALNSCANEVEPYDFCISEQHDENISIQVFEANVVTAATHNVPQSSPPATCEGRPAFEKEQSPDLTGLSELFMIDTEPAKMLNTIQVPSYKRAIKDVLDDETAERKKKKEQEVDKCLRPRASAACFNCGSTEHAIRECTKTRNMQRINRAKKAFTSSRQERYHVDIEQRFAHLRPGIISDKLRTALGVQRGELPFFFYRMRALGYPPGWLEDAKVSHSGIALFNSDGTAVLKSDEDDGEVESMNHKYDVSKIIEFPGYNANPGANFYDDYKHHNVPPLNPLQMKNEFVKTLGDNIIKGYKRKKLKDLPAANDRNANECTQNNATMLEVADMELEDADVTTQGNVIFTRPMPPLEPPNDNEDVPPPPPPMEAPPTAEDIWLPSTATCSSMEERSQSPTLADLEEQQELLLKQLQAANTSAVSIISDEPEDSLIDEVMALEDTTQNNLDVSIIATVDDTESMPAPQTPLKPSTPLPTDATDDDNNISDIIFKESHMGTPLLKFSPFDKLPAGDNFKVGVSDVINFENLPDSTGKYEQMKVVIKKVRNIITKLHSEDD